MITFEQFLLESSPLKAYWITDKGDVLDINGYLHGKYPYKFPKKMNTTLDYLRQNFGPSYSNLNELEHFDVVSMFLAKGYVRIGTTLYSDGIKKIYIQGLKQQILKYKKLIEDIILDINPDSILIDYTITDNMLQKINYELTQKEFFDLY